MGSVPVRIPRTLLKDVDAMVAEGYRGATDRTDILRDALVPLIEAWKATRHHEMAKGVA